MLASAQRSATSQKKPVASVRGTEGTPNSFACKHASLGVACGGHAVLALSLGPVQLIVCLLDEVLQARHVFG
jgi:hypothetical protein